MNCLFIAFVVLSIAVMKAQNIQRILDEYFSSDVMRSFEKQWNSFKFSYEHAIAYTLQEDFGHKSMNVYINRFHKPLLLAAGYYHTDNQVKLVFKDLTLESLPHLYDIDVSFPMASNVMMVDASVSKIILQTSYALFRNTSDIIFSPADQDPYKNSPFRFQQVRNVGDLAISLEGCSLSGIIVTTLNGNSVNIGHNELRLKDCQYNVEIYKLGSGDPPVIANYLPKGETGLNLEILTSRAMLEELVPRLQGVMFSEVNTSAVFTKDLPKFRRYQEALFEKTKNFVDEIVRSMNTKSIEMNMGTIDLEDFIISWDDTVPSVKSVKLSKMTLLGLDTLYASHTGGPVRLTNIEILEQLRFNMLQVVGKVSLEGLQDDSAFALEISDLAVDVNIDSGRGITFEVLGWRFLAYSCPELEFIPTEALVVGYLLNVVPKVIKTHLNSVYNSDGQLKDFVEEQTVDGTNHLSTNEISDPRLDDFESENRPEDLDVDPEEELVKLRDGGAKTHKKVQRTKQAHHLNNNGTQVKNIDKKSREKVRRTKLNVENKKVIKTANKEVKRIKNGRRNGRNKSSVVNRKTNHSSNNEIHSN